MDDTNNALEVEWVGIDEVFPNPANPRQNDEAVEPVAASLRRFGWRQPIVAKPSGEVVAGNTRLKAARQLGMDCVPVVRFDGSDTEAAAYGIADNRTHEFSGWDDRALVSLLEALRAEDALDGVGYTPEQVDALLAAVSRLEGEDEIEEVGPPEPPEEPVSRPGDVWLLGDHRLVCGDSRDRDVLASATARQLVDMLWTDPPYGVAYTGKTADELQIENDALDEDQLGALLEASLGGALEACRPGAAWYIAAPAGPNFLPFARVLHHLGVWRQTLVWLKDTLVLGRSDYHYRHEAIFYGWKPGAAHREPPNRKQDTVWVFERPKASRDHPTMKPVALVAHALRMSSVAGEAVLDPFCGSGTTILAAEATGRRCCAVELDPRYCDVCVRRWEQVTDQQAVLEGTDRTFAEVGEERGVVAHEAQTVEAGS